MGNHLPGVLIPFGFTFADNRYTYREVFMEGSLRQWWRLMRLVSCRPISGIVRWEVYTAHLVTAAAGLLWGQVRGGLSVHFGSGRGGLLCCSAIFQGPKQPHSPAHQGAVGRPSWLSLWQVTDLWGLSPSLSIISGTPWSVRFRGQAGWERWPRASGDCQSQGRCSGK